jgi:hypothetical protein
MFFDEMYESGLPPPDLPPEFETDPEVRRLLPDVLPALLDLEHEKWTDEQAASAADLWRRMEHASPIPGLSNWLAANPAGKVEDYVHEQRAGLPADPQLRYYHSRGFKDILCVKPGYFPHERSRDHGVILRGNIPLSALLPVWKVLPLTSSERVTRQLVTLL